MKNGDLGIQIDSRNPKRQVKCSQKIKSLAILFFAAYAGSVGIVIKYPFNIIIHPQVLLQQQDSYTLHITSLSLSLYHSLESPFNIALQPLARINRLYWMGVPLFTIKPPFKPGSLTTHTHIYIIR